MENNNDVSDPFRKINEFVASLSDLLNSKASDEVFNVVLESENEELVKSACLDIIDLVGNRLLDGRVFHEDISEWHNLENVLDYVVKICNPRECLLGLLNLIEETSSDEFFEFVVNRLRDTFLRLSKKRGETFIWALNRMYAYIFRIPVPEAVDELSEDEKPLLENCVELIRAEKLITTTLTFVNPFISEAKECKLIDSEEQRRQQIFTLCAYVLKLVERPVAFFEYETDSRKGNVHRRMCVKLIITMLFGLNANFIKLIEWQTRNLLTLKCPYMETDGSATNFANFDPNVGPTAVGVLAYFIFCRGVCRDKIPWVYEHEYLFETLLFSINASLKNEYATITDYGLNLLNFFADRFSASSSNLKKWTVERLNDSTYQRLFLCLIHATTFTKKAASRKSALSIFDRYVRFFDVSAQTRIIHMIFYVVGEGNFADYQDLYLPNKGICGYLIDYFRSRFNEEIRCGKIEEEKHKKTTSYAQNLWPILRLCTKLERAEETDLLDRYDQFGAALNLIRFLCILHANGKFILPQSVISELSKNFVEPVRKGLEISKAHYELDMKNSEKEKLTGGEGPFLPVTGQKMNILKSATNSFDLMMSLVARVDELLVNCATVARE